MYAHGCTRKGNRSTGAVDPGHWLGSVFCKISNTDPYFQKIWSGQDIQIPNPLTIKLFIQYVLTYYVLNTNIQNVKRKFYGYILIGWVRFWFVSRLDPVIFSLGSDPDPSQLQVDPQPIIQLRLSTREKNMYLFRYRLSAKHTYFIHGYIIRCFYLLWLNHQ